MLKEMGRGGVVPRRMVALLAVVAVVLGIFSVRLFQVQIVHGEKYSKMASDGYRTVVSLAASRGEIVDRNQTPLVSNRTSFAVVLKYNYFPGKEQYQEQNDCLLALTELLKSQKEQWNDSLPISMEAPYTFAEGRENGIAKMKKTLQLNSYATEEQCLKAMVERYHLKGYKEQEQRILAGIHYEMEAAGFSEKVPYTFAGDVSKVTRDCIVQQSKKFPGVDVPTMPVREYVGGVTACHIIGTVGPIYAEEYESLKKQGYLYNDILGKSGIEKAAEKYLRGIAGQQELIKDRNGKITEKETVAPQPGKTVVLSLDATVQNKAQEALREIIEELRANGKEGKGKDVKSGSVVLLDVSDGGVLTCASWPDYDLSTYSLDYNKLIADPDKPLFNRALNGSFPCGSVFKPGVALAGITDESLKGDEIINCTYTYDYYTDYKPKCMSHHGHLSVITAIEKSCNYFFYEAGRRMGSSIFNYLSAYGFGQKTGVEIDESSGIQYSPDSLRVNGQTWVAGDYLRLAIGQQGAYTPIQLAAYAMMIANDGVRYKTHFIHSIRSYDNSTETVIPAEIEAKVVWSNEAIKQVRKGMIAVGKTGTAKSAFADAPYTVACKTGTAQTGVAGASDHGTFIAYAPADNPEVAISVVLENGNSASAAATARKVLDAYFEGKTAGEKPTPDGVLLP